MDSHTFAQIAKALSDPKRVELLQALEEKAIQCNDYQCCDLSEKCCNVGEITDRIGLAISTTSYHLKELKRAGLVQTSKRGKQVYVELNFPLFRELSDYFESFLEPIQPETEVTP
ncbi:MAG: helix-turn-helix domain-containing protein [Candidatus Marinimicrobia bacterium]|nr:helix-turn-helix domain-containing protein [Candidatus Neomarinimicrobiota bacterium]MCF7827877.1 helix-turn-helix domain-containing protein [Candidatus Neomarinimicrobiota bacterium]MCF7879368.1 helix-turn-helix domain-containing protein [Candidatus Neomarinimicrobiota bacterium]